MRLEDLTPAQRRQIRARKVSVRADHDPADSTKSSLSRPTKGGEARTEPVRRTKGGSVRGEFQCARCPFEGSSWSAMEKHSDEHRHARIILRLEAS